MILFFTAFACALAIALIAKLVFKGICWKEFGVMLGVQLIVAGISAAICYHQTLADEETINSYVVNKKQNWVSCRHSYSCNCRTVSSGSGKNKTSYVKCDTCYEHSNDWDWDVYDAIGRVFTIDRVDRRGTREPPRWTAVQMGEPTARTQSYDNYVKAAPDTLFRHQGLVEKFAGKIPEYPQDRYDYYRMDRLVRVNGAQVEDPQYWNADISQLNAEMGTKKQANVVVVVTRDMPQEYFFALEQAWVGGKKNDVILVVNLDHNRKPTWASVMAWESNEIFKIKVRDEIMDRPTVDRWDVVDVLKRNIVQYHVRKPMKDFEYLTASIVPSTGQWLATLIIGFIIGLGLAVFFHHNEVFPDYRRRYPYSY